MTRRDLIVKSCAIVGNTFETIHKMFAESASQVLDNPRNSLLKLRCLERLVQIQTSNSSDVLKRWREQVQKVNFNNRIRTDKKKELLGLLESAVGGGIQEQTY